MKIADLPFEVTDWAQIEPTVHPGETGTALWHTRQLGAIRVRLVEYTPGYRADHWCSKGHIVFCHAGELTTELGDGRTVVLTAGMSYDVADGDMPHRSSSAVGAKLFIVD
jgi:hypothetical protein